MCNLKDSSFDHEAEIRLAVRLGQASLYERLLQSKNFMDKNHEYHNTFIFDIEAFSLLNQDLTPPREFITCPEDLIESVAIDPRCPIHKADFMRQWFKSHNIKVVTSSCFGYLPDTFNTYPKY